jgi:Flp pilus assembly protein TadG
VLPLTVLLTVFLLGCIAFAVDIGYMIMVRAELQNAADAASLAGTSQLLDRNVLKGGTQNTATAIDTAMANGRAEAKKFALLNKGGAVELVLDGNADNAEGGDIVFGYIANPMDYDAPLVRTVPGVGPYPNSTQVTVHRDTTRNGQLSLFFAPVLGQRYANLQGRATATYEGGISGFQIQAAGYGTAKLLPFALDVNAWNAVVSGTGPDDFTRDPATGAVTAGSDGVHEVKLFPLSNGNGSGESGLPPGNFGTIDIGSPNNSTADLSRQIREGVNAQDLSYFAGGKLQLDPDTHTLVLQGDTGVSAGVKDDLTAIIGTPRIIPLYSTVSGPGNNARYTIVGFAGVTVLEVVLTGSLSEKHVTIEPAFVIDPNALGGSPDSSFFVTKPLALTR